MARAFNSRQLARIYARMADLQEMAAIAQSAKAFGYRQPDVPTVDTLLDEMQQHSKSVSSANSAESSERQAIEYDRKADEDGEPQLPVVTIEPADTDIEAATESSIQRKRS